MSQNAFDAAAASILQGKEPSAAEPQVEIEAPKKRGRPKGSKNVAQSGRVVDMPIVDPQEMAKVIRPFLQHIAAVTNTAPPVKDGDTDEAANIGGALAYGLRESSVMMEKAGPWTPFFVALSFYAVPRVLDVTLRYFERKQQQEEAERESASGFRHEIPEEFESVEVAPSSPSPAVGVPAIGAKRF